MVPLCFLGVWLRVFSTLLTPLVNTYLVFKVVTHSPKTLVKGGQIFN